MDLRGKKGLSSVVSNVLLIMIVVVAVGVIGTMVLNTTKNLGDTVSVKECAISNPNDANMYNDCLVKTLGAKANSYLLDTKTSSIKNGQIVTLSADTSSQNNPSSDFGNLNAQSSSIDCSSDLTDPSISIVSPLNGSSVNGIINVQINTLDDKCLSKAELRISNDNDWVNIADITLTGTNNQSTFSLDTRLYSNGEHNMDNIVFDVAGNYSWGNTIKININN